MWHAAASSSPPPITAPCSTATTGRVPNWIASKAECQRREWAMPAGTEVSVSEVRSRPEEKWSPVPTSTTARTSAGGAVKYPRKASTVASSSALRLSGRLSASSATAPRRSTVRQFGTLPASGATSSLPRVCYGS